MSEPYVIEVDGLKKYFPLRDGLFGQQTGELRAVDGVSFNIRPGTIFGLVGESGSGKTTVGRTLLGLYEKPCALSGPRCSWCFRTPIAR